MSDTSSAGEANANDTTPPRVSDSLMDILEPYLDRPRGWIFENKERLQLLIDRWGGDVVIKALENCLSQGKIDFFFKDFGRFRPEQRDMPHLFTPHPFHIPTDEEDKHVSEMAAEFRRAHGMREYRP